MIFCASLTSVIGAAYTSVSFLKTFSPAIQKNENYWIIGFIAISSLIMVILGGAAKLLVLAGALNGLGDTAGPSVISAVCVWGLRLPLSLLVAADYGVVGIWAVMCGELSVRGIIMYGRLAHRTRRL